jgi:CheY-like chemotaxis protein
LVVDDDPSTCEILRLFLEPAGYKIDGAANGREALEQLDRSKPAVILLDLSMPVMDGATFRKHQLKSPALANIPVVLLSGECDTAEQAKRLGVSNFHRKPIDIHWILRSVQKLAPPQSVTRARRLPPARTRTDSRRTRPAL